MKALSFDDISLVPRYNNIPSRRDVNTNVKFGALKLSVPIFSSNMDTITGSKMARAMYAWGGLGFLHRFCSIDNNIKLYQEATVKDPIDNPPAGRGRHAVVSLGVNEGLDRFLALYEVGARYFCIDVAHGHSRSVGQFVQQIKEFDDKVFIVAGNVCEAVGASYLADKGADAIKVGVGPGSVCSTRVQTGFGVPQFTAIRQCSRANCFIIADGGIRSGGDAVKAFYAGADAIMIGGMLSGTDETPGEVFYDPPFVGSELGREEQRQYKLFRGMASKEAQEDFMGSQAEWKTAEGIEIEVEAKGPAGKVIANLKGGIHSGMTYCGANTLGQIRERADHVEVTAFGRHEGTPHGQK